MTEAEIMARVETACDEPRAFVIALMEHLKTKTFNYGAVRACEPLVSVAEAAVIVGRVPGIVKALGEERGKAVGIQPSGLLLPPSAR
jgi:hypothetical protein